MHVNSSTITGLVDKVVVAAENDQANVLNNTIKSVILATPQPSLVNSPVSDCGFAGDCFSKPIGSQVNPQINNIYGVKK